MTNYRYAAKGPGGKTVEGTITAADKNEAVAELRRKNLVVMNVEETAERSAKARKDPNKGGLFAPRPVAKKNELVIFTRQLSTMISAGLAMMESLEVLRDQAESPGMRVVCSRVASQVRNGSDLSVAMETCPKVFDKLYISMVRAGEVSGQMDIVLDRLADYQEEAAALKREIISAMTYPIVSMVLVLAITSFLMIGVVPSFRQVFDSLDSELPAITEFVLNLSDSMRTNWMAIFGGLFGVIIGFSMFKKTPTGERFSDRMMLKVPVFGHLLRMVALARFSRTFATLIRSGVPIMTTLDIVADTAGNSVVADAVMKSKEAVRNGNQLSEPLGQAKIFPPMVVRMVAIGERTGALETLLEKIAEFYDAQVKAHVQALTSLIEPLLISFMGVMVGAVVLAVFLPILDVVGKLGGGG